MPVRIQSRFHQRGRRGTVAKVARTSERQRMRIRIQPDHNQQMSQTPENPGKMSGIDTPDDDTGVAANTQDTEWDLTTMSAAHIEGSEYRILSTRNNTVTHYRVDVDEGTCECPSTEYNLAENEACPHLTKALVCHTSHLDGGEWAIRDLQTVTDRANNLMHDLRETTDWVTTVIESEAAGSASQAVQNDGQVSTPDGSTVESVDIAERQETLQAAFDEVINGFNTEYSGGWIWVNKSPDAPESLPGPGNIDSFEALLQNPEPMEFVPDDDGRDTDRPGQYFKNAIAPDAVESYISEVLE